MDPMEVSDAQRNMFKNHVSFNIEEVQGWVHKRMATGGFPILLLHAVGGGAVRNSSPVVKVVNMDAVDRRHAGI